MTNQVGSKGRGKQAGALGWGQCSPVVGKDGKTRYKTGVPDPHIPGKVHWYPGPRPTRVEEATAWLRKEKKYADDCIADGTEWLSPEVRKAAEDARVARTVQSYAYDWLVARDVKPLTLREYERAVRLRIVPKVGKGDKAVELGKMRLTTLDGVKGRAIIIKWWNALDREKNPRACAKAYEALRTMLNAAVLDGFISMNPCKKIPGAGKPSRTREIEPLTPAQVQAVADQMPPNMRLAILLAAWCNLRSGELRALRWEDVDLEKGVLTVNKQVVELPNPKTTAEGMDPRLVEVQKRLHSGINDKAPIKTSEQTNAPTTVPIPAVIREDIRQHLITYCGDGKNPLLFRRPDGRPVLTQQLDAQFHQACAAAGVSDGVPHDLRHVGLTYATLAGATPKEVMRLGRHTTMKAAERYQEVARPHLDIVQDRLSELIAQGRMESEMTTNLG